jgi:hypothetical protein
LYFVLVLTGPMYPPFCVKLKLKLLWVYSLDMPSMWYTNKQIPIWGGNEKVFSVVQVSVIYIYAKKTLHGFSPQSNYTDRMTAACWRWRVSCGQHDSPPVVNFGFLYWSCYFLEMAPQLSSRG